MIRKEYDINLLVGLRVRQLREKKGMSQEKLGFESGVHRTYIGQIERAEKNISIVSIGKVIKKLDVDIHEFFNFSSLFEQDSNKKK